MKKIIFLVILIFTINTKYALSACPDGGPPPCGRYGGGSSSSSSGSSCPDGGPQPCGRYGGNCPDGGPPPCGRYGSSSSGISSGGSSSSSGSSYGQSDKSASTSNQPSVRNVIILKSGGYFVGVIVRSSPESITLKTTQGKMLNFLRKDINTIGTSEGIKN